MIVELCASLAPWAAIFVFMAPLLTMKKIREDKSVGTLPLLPYSSMVASAFMWTTYGILKREPKVWSANVVGLCLGLYYMDQFIRHAPSAAPTFPGTVRQHALVVIGMTAGTLMVALSPFLSDPAALIGPAGVLLTITLFASPLSALKTVVQSKSAASIPLPFTLASMANCFMWSVLGLFQMYDANIYVPNLLGLTFTVVQAALKVYYGDGHAKGQPLPM